jgi:PIN domain nuclease of toxin-antitoxin system
LRLLLDTHVFIWWCAGDRRLRASGRKAIRDATEVLVSAASAWEIAIKVALGKLEFPVTTDSAVRTAGFAELPIRSVHADATRRLPDHHRDPFDRLLIAQARIEGLTFVTADRALQSYEVEALWV